MAKRNRTQDPLAGFDQVATIARGAAATVLSGRDVNSGQLVAIKLLEHPGGGDVDQAAFDREVRALGALSRHPNVVTLHRAQLTPDGRPMLVLELCDGSLADRLAEQGPLALRTVVAVGVALAGALETAHRAGVVHGDVRPGNVLVTRYGEVALADFGVAALREAAADPAGPIPATWNAEAAPARGIQHTAPEVLRGAGTTVVSDLYSLASTMFELLTGSPPFGGSAGDDAEVVRERILRDPAPPLEVPGIPTGLHELLHRTLSKDPTARPASPLELAQHLRAIEQAAGWGATPCRVGQADGSWRFPLDTGAVATRRGRAAAVTGLPPLQLGAPPLDGEEREHGPERRREPRIGPAYAQSSRRADPGAWRAPDPAVARPDLPPPTPGPAPAVSPPDADRDDLPPGARDEPVGLPPPAPVDEPVDLPPPGGEGRR
ncbi:serine/threonine-protein kinase [Nitriliruptor alkaliphilus]|uniref:serine/threonine-protein kinase n=1 Tax=Nitriliruptor alkaliphilus TaxID=427918 RepID=UPI0009F8FB90|nr:serine/threonine-protein kinase [Nitriliruptor alkaliphilus]